MKRKNEKRLNLNVNTNRRIVNSFNSYTQERDKRGTKTNNEQTLNEQVHQSCTKRGRSDI